MRKKKEEREAEKEDELREIRRPAKSFCVARLVTAGDPEPLEGVYKQVKGCGSSAWFGQPCQYQTWHHLSMYTTM